MHGQWSEISWLKSCITPKGVNTRGILFMVHMKAFGPAPNSKLVVIGESVLLVL